MHIIQVAALLSLNPNANPFLNSFNRAFSFERGKSGIEHQPNGIDELVGVRSRSEEYLDHQMLEHGITL